MPTKMVNSSSILRNTQLPEIHTSHERFIMEKPEQYLVSITIDMDGELAEIR